MKRDPLRIQGALYGVAIGDALGLTVEGMTAQEIQNTYGQLREIVGGGWLRKQRGQVTDDTYMTLCVAAGIAETPQSPYEGIGRRFIGWYRTNPPEIGRCCALAIGKAQELLGQGVLENEAWERGALFAQEQLGNRCAGNGALMRDVYPGLFYPVEMAHLLSEGVERLCKHSKMVYGGALVGRDMGKGGAFVTPELEQQARAFAAQLLQGAAK